MPARTKDGVLQPVARGMRRNFARDPRALYDWCGMLALTQAKNPDSTRFVFLKQACEPQARPSVVFSARPRLPRCTYTLNEVGEHDAVPKITAFEPAGVRDSRVHGIGNAPLQVRSDVPIISDEVVREVTVPRLAEHEDSEFRVRRASPDFLGIAHVTAHPMTPNV